MINCTVCGKLTPKGTRGRAKKYCSYECAYPRKKIQPENCLVCNTQLQIENNGRPRLTCSRLCRSRRDAQLKAKPKPTLDCAFCNERFSSSHGAKFCGYRCRKQNYNLVLRSKPKDTTPKTLICGWCDTGVQVPHNFTGPKKYHPECKVRARRARYRIKTVRRQSLTVKPSRLSADQLVDAMGAVCGICKDPIDMTLKRTSRMGLTVDHIIPLSKGGQDTLDNMQPAHWLCNVKKGNKIDA